MREMACGISVDVTATSTVLLLLVLLQAALVWEEARGAPPRKSDILAGTEFLSVFINGAMAPTPQRRRGGGGFRRGGQAASSSDSATAESHQHEASIYRISRNPNVRPVVSRPPNGREEVVRFYPISQRTLENRQQNLASLIDDLSTPGGIRSTRLTPTSATTTTMASSLSPTLKDPTTSNGTDGFKAGVSRQKVIGVSVTSTVEATPYKVRVEHYDSADAAVVVTRPPSSEPSVNREAADRDPPVRSTVKGAKLPSTTTATTPSPARFVTEELSNIVSESNRSEFSVDEESPRMSWRGRVTMTPQIQQTPAFLEDHQDEELNEATRTIDDTITLPTEENYELPVENSEPRELNEEPPEMPSDRLQPQNRKAARHYDAPIYNRPGPKVYSQSSKVYKPSRTYSEPAKVYSEPERVYGEPAKVYSEPAKVYSEPAKVYSEPAKVYGEPAKVYGEPEKVYSEPSKIYSEPAKVYSEPAKIYSQPAKVYGEPSKVYDSEGQPMDRQQGGDEPDEQNYEIDESVSVGSNGNVHGPVVTEIPSTSETEDSHKVGYVVEGRNFRKYRVEERTPDGFIVGEYGVVSHDDGSLRGVRYTADGTIDPQLIYDALKKFLSL
ncbi:PREDICTED: uncharacterized protein LOC106741251 [Dinoponera quadriceps]|uniref:Uncharacterized protein LOC106741251 n=1 Tax=Dinoponera quadriceps TaxID=609295 RepID=A0A6P3WRS3_DINQU|nr:PREDICTED: uncharacterized protein LOC106741251 [Dinoponera quadriceps]